MKTSRVPVAVLVAVLALCLGTVQASAAIARTTKTKPHTTTLARASATPATTFTFQGVLQTSKGEAITDSLVTLNAGSVIEAQATSSSSGAFSMSVPAGDQLSVANGLASPPPPLPFHWSVIGIPITISGDLTQNLTVPVATVTAEVRRSSNNPVNQAGIGVPAGVESSAENVALWPGGPTSAGFSVQLSSGSVYNRQHATPPSTSRLCMFVATPPDSDTAVGPAQLTTDITGDTTLTFTLPPVVTFQGVLQTSKGEAITDSLVTLNAGSVIEAQATSSSSGAFSMSVPAGSYQLSVANGLASPPPPLPFHWSVIGIPITISGISPRT